MQQQLLGFLRKHVGSEEKFTDFLSRLDAAVASGKEWESFAGGKITPEVLKGVIAELRPLCEFPIRPELSDLQVSPSLTPFDRSLEMFGSKSRHVDPNLVPFQVMYMKLADHVVSFVKAVKGFETHLVCHDGTGCALYNLIKL